MKKFALFFIFVALSPSSYGNDRPTVEAARKLCDEAGISSLQFGTVHGFTPGSDYCSSPSHFFNFPGINVHEISRNLLLQVRDLNLKAVELLELNGGMAELFSGKQPRLMLLPDSSGPLQSSVSKQAITLGVFSRWQGLLDSGIYVHELGHFVAKSLPPSMEYFKYLNEIQIFEEMIPDFFSLQIGGGLATHIPELPACLQDVRPELGRATYNYPSGFFRSTDVGRRFKECCAQLDGERYPLGANMCRALVNSQVLLNIPEFSREPLDPQYLRRTTQNPKDRRLVYDSHRLGIPMMGFFQALEKTLKQPVMKNWFRYLKTLNTKETQWTCRTKGDLGIFSHTVNQFSWEQALKNYIDSLKTRENSAAIERIWDFYAIEKTQALMLSSQRDLAIRDTAIKYVKVIREPLYPSKVCLDELVNGDWMKEDNRCHIVCE